jgi:hypothetical protein
VSATMDNSCWCFGWVPPWIIVASVWVSTIMDNSRWCFGWVPLWIIVVGVLGECHHG